MRKHLFTFLMCLSLFFVVSSVKAQDENKNPLRQENTNEQHKDENIHSSTQPDPTHHPIFEKAEKEPDHFQSKFLNMILMLGLLIGLMVAASWFLKRMMSSRQQNLNTTSLIRVLETRPLSPKSALYVLDVMGVGIVIAESATGVQFLTRIQLNEVAREDE